MSSVFRQSCAGSSAMAWFRRATALLVASVAAMVAGAAALPVFPGATGYGTDTPAGRWGEIYVVTNLNDDGPGSLRHGLEAVQGPRVIVFEVSGVIRLKSNLILRDASHGDFGHVTIAGQTAPAPGITLAGAGLNVMASHVLVQHLAIRPGDRLKPVDNRDAVMVGAKDGQRTHHVVFDHVSASWAVDETLSTWSDTGEVSDVTLINSIISKPILNGGHSKGSHPYGVLGGRNTSRFSIVRNIMAFNMGRTPLIRDRTPGALVVNNYIYHPGIWTNGAIYIGNLPLAPHAASIVGNVIIRRPLPTEVERTTPEGVREKVVYRLEDYRNPGIYVHDEAEAGVGLWLRDNRLLDPRTQEWHPKNGDPYDPEIFRDARTPVRRLEQDPYADAGVTAWPAEVVEDRLLAGAGKWPAQRDAIDAKLIDEIRSRTGKYLEDLAEEGEDPWASVDSTQRRALSLPKNPQGDDDGDGYTNLEEWLHELAAVVEGRAS